MTVLLIVIQLGINMVCMINDFASMVLSVGITMLLCGPVYFLMVNRVRKRFVSLVYMTLLGIVFLIMGNWFLLPVVYLGRDHCGSYLMERSHCKSTDSCVDGIQPSV